MNANTGSNGLDCPKLAWVIMTILGCLDLVRGFIHTFLIEYAAQYIMGLDLAVARNDQLLLMGTFGISNYITGMMLILIAMKARNIVPYVFLVIPVSYLGGVFLISRVASSTARLGGLPMMTIYIAVCILSFVAIVIWKNVKKEGR